MIKLTDKEFITLVGYLKENFGINLINKRVLIEGRLGNHLASIGFNNYTDYLKAVQADKTGKELSTLLNKVTTNHTYFMRESDHFDYFAKAVLPYWEPRVGNRDLRVWCAASSSGEEPYTLAMILEDYFGGKVPKWDKALLATDISQRVLEQAKEGIYLEEGVEKIPPAWRKKYFTSLGDGRVQVAESIRKQVAYRIFNLMDPVRYKEPFHAIFCRNVMIYFDQPTKAAVADRLYDALRPGGYLFVGHTESVAKPTRFRYVMPSVYQKGV
ncbi:MAG: protein-glutamate O-methyltransferase CheR [Oscillospiraceae bacterium]|jgi:chemotaxis protein methyltransferase CheR|nr:protein-glutamate O-methyltransferase CheR [Oscillospiraceae bacterium]